MNLPLNIDFQQILLHLLNFVILAGGLYLLLYKPVNKFIKKKRGTFRFSQRGSGRKTEQSGTIKNRIRTVDAKLRRRNREKEIRRR